MDLFETIKKRHCVREFNPRQMVKREDLEKIIEAGQSAPSAGGIHPVKFRVVTDREIKEDLAKAAFGQSFLTEAPVVIVIFVDLKKPRAKYGTRGENLYAIQDAAAAAENIFLAAIALGLSACWIGGFEEEAVKRILGFSLSERPMVMMPIGYKR